MWKIVLNHSLLPVSAYTLPEAMSPHPGAPQTPQSTMKLLEELISWGIQHPQFSSGSVTTLVVFGGEPSTLHAYVG